MRRPPSVAVCLTTCGRLDYTRRTLETFAAHNDLGRFQLYHGDDASKDQALMDLVQSYGFRTVFRTTTKGDRIGGYRLRAEIVRRINRSRAEWVLTLENDIESVRPFPWRLFDAIKENRHVYCLRLYGAFKDAAKTDPCLTWHKWKPNADHPVSWKPMKGAPEPAEIGQIHWSPQPCVTRYEDMTAFCHQGYLERKKKTVRVVDNVMVHIGTTRTREVV